MREKNVEYIDVALCKLCQSPHRLIIEMWRYSLKRTYRQLCDFVNNQTSYNLNLNPANCSAHFTRHVSESSFWVEYTRHMNEETNCKESRSPREWQQYWANLKP